MCSDRRVDVFTTFFCYNDITHAGTGCDELFHHAAVEEVEPLGINEAVNCSIVIHIIAFTSSRHCPSSGVITDHWFMASGRPTVHGQWFNIRTTCHVTVCVHACLTLIGADRCLQTATACVAHMHACTSIFIVHVNSCVNKGKLG